MQDELHRSCGGISRSRAQCAATSSTLYFKCTRLSEGNCFVRIRPAAARWRAGSAAVQNRRRSSGRHCAACCRRNPRRTCIRRSRSARPQHSAAGPCRNIRSSAGVAAPWVVSRCDSGRSSQIGGKARMTNFPRIGPCGSRAFILRDGADAPPQDEVLHPHGEERGKAARLEPCGPDASADYLAAFNGNLALSFSRSSTIDERTCATLWCGISTLLTRSERSFRSRSTTFST